MTDGRCAAGCCARAEQSEGTVAPAANPGCLNFVEGPQLHQACLPSTLGPDKAAKHR